MFTAQSHRTIFFLLLIGGAIDASLFWFGPSAGTRTELATGAAVDPQQIMREQKDLPAQALSDFSVIFPEKQGSLPSSP